tara:strand:+ start:6379 stop:6876 length:498 start_codon:yes stop_codon:yes gene_type:complete
MVCSYCLVELADDHAPWSPALSQGDLVRHAGEAEYTAPCDVAGKGAGCERVQTSDGSKAAGRFNFRRQRIQGVPVSGTNSLEVFDSLTARSSMAVHNLPVSTPGNWTVDSPKTSFRQWLSCLYRINGSWSMNNSVSMFVKPLAMLPCINPNATGRCGCMSDQTVQ